MGNSVRVFLNAKSGSGGASAQHIAELFAKYGSHCSISSLGKHTDAQRLARTDPQDTVFVAAGGDGTVNLVAQAVAGTSRRMGVLPVGTLNHFAKDLNLPLDLEAAVELIADGQSRQVDAAEVNGFTFVNNSSLGVYPSMVVAREHMKKFGHNKWASLVAASARAFVRFRCMTVQFQVDGKTRVCDTPFLFVGNNDYCLEGTRLGAREHMDQGRLSLYLAPGATRSTMLRLLASALLGRLKKTSDFEVYQPMSFRVTTKKRSLRGSLDGEVRRIATPLEYRIRPAALNVICLPSVKGGEQA
jgi:diacylglycerol kinase family enzyme